MEYPQEKVMPYGNEGKKAEQVEQMFDHIAPTYDRLNHLMSMGIDRRWRKKAIRWLAPFRPQDVMDVATGTGDFALLACRMLQPRALTGVDISEGMMQVARQKAQDAGLDGHIRFRREDCEALTFPDASFDAVTVAFGVRNFEHLDLGLREMCRVLRPGGHLVILELSTPDRFPMKQLFALYSRVAMPVIQHFARQQCLHLPAGEHPRLPAGRGDEPEHPPRRLLESQVQAADVRGVHAVYGDEISI